jgi:hypothetical protein
VREALEAAEAEGLQTFDLETVRVHWPDPLRPDDQLLSRALNLMISWGELVIAGDALRRPSRKIASRGPEPDPDPDNPWPGILSALAGIAFCIYLGWAFATAATVGWRVTGSLIGVALVAIGLAIWSRPRRVDAAPLKPHLRRDRLDIQA